MNSIMRLGIVARSDSTGLGIQTEGYYRNLEPTKTMVVDISKWNGNKQYTERYLDNQIGEVKLIKGFPTDQDIDEFLTGLDVVLIAEAAYNPYLYTRAKELNVKTAVQYNYEFFDWFINPHYPKPDMLIAPSKWHYETVDDWCKQNNIEHVYLHCPVNRELLPFRNIKKARTFLHVAGRSAAHDRNGTETVIEASALLETDAEILIHFQGEQGLAHQATNSIADYTNLLEERGDPDKVTIQVIDYKDYHEVYKDGDVFLLPRRYGGNCLPLNEALSVGMPAIMSDVSPNNRFLPHDWLVSAQKINVFTPRTVIDIYDCDVYKLAEKIDEFYRMSESEMWFQNLKANDLATSIDWRIMKDQYYNTLEQLCHSSDTK